MRIKVLAIGILFLFLSSCSIFHKQESIEHKKHGELCRSKSKEWLLQNARFPDSYKPVNFSSIEESCIVEPQEWFFFSTVRTIPDSERFAIIHQYYITGSNNQPDLLFSKFVFDKDFNVKEFVFSTTEFTFTDSGLHDELQWQSLYGKRGAVGN